MVQGSNNGRRERKQGTLSGKVGNECDYVMDVCVDVRVSRCSSSEVGELGMDRELRARGERRADRAKSS